MQVKKIKFLNFNKKRGDKKKKKGNYFITLKCDRIKPTQIGIPLFTIHKKRVAMITAGAATPIGSKSNKAYPARVAASEAEIVGVIVVKR